MLHLWLLFLGIDVIDVSREGPPHQALFLSNSITVLINHLTMMSSFDTLHEKMKKTNILKSETHKKYRIMRNILHEKLVLQCTGRWVFAGESSTGSG